MRMSFEIVPRIRVVRNHRLLTSHGVRRLIPKNVAPSTRSVASRPSIARANVDSQRTPTSTESIEDLEDEVKTRVGDEVSGQRKIRLERYESGGSDEHIGHAARRAEAAVDANCRLSSHEVMTKTLVANSRSRFFFTRGTLQCIHTVIVTHEIHRRLIDKYLRESKTDVSRCRKAAMSR